MLYVETTGDVDAHAQDRPPAGKAAELKADGSISADTRTAETGDETSNQYLVGISYDLAKGVNLGAYGAYVDFNDASAGLSDDSVDGFIIGTGIKIKF